MAGGNNSKKDGGVGLFDNINVTPLVDVFLVLLIITMVTVTLDQFTAYKVKHAEGSSGTPPPVEDQITVSIEADGNFYLGMEAVAGDSSTDRRDNLSKLIIERKKNNPRLDTVSIIPDREAKAQYLIDVFEASKAAKITKYSLIAKVKK